MPLDARVAWSVAWCPVIAIALAGCPRTTAPEAPGTEPTSPAVAVGPRPSQGTTSAMLGELCMTGAGGRPGISPLVARAVTWTSEPQELVASLDRNQTGAFAVLGVDGRRVGVFGAIGVAEQAGGSVAIGSYAGGSPCALPAAAGAKAGEDAACVAATARCGLAVASVSTGGGFAALDPPDVTVGGACVSGDGVVVDIDGDGAGEVFPLAGFLDGSRAPVDELTAAAVVAGPCQPTFTRYGVAIAVDAAITDPRHKVTLDILGVVDVDGDGRRELVIGLRYAERRTIAVYAADGSASRLALIGELEPWPRD